MGKKNKYKLDKKKHIAANTIVAQATMRYDLDSDSVNTIVLIREDIESDDFQLRIGRQFEHALRTVIPSYAHEMSQVERLAKMGADIGVLDKDD